MTNPVLQGNSSSHERSGSASKHCTSPRFWPSKGNPTITGHCCWEHATERNNPIIIHIEENKTPTGVPETFSQNNLPPSRCQPWDPRLIVLKTNSARWWGSLKSETIGNCWKRKLLETIGNYGKLLETMVPTLKNPHFERITAIMFLIEKYVFPPVFSWPRNDWIHCENMVI